MNIDITSYNSICNIHSSNIKYIKTLWKKKSICNGNIEEYILKIKLLTWTGRYLVKNYWLKDTFGKHMFWKHCIKDIFEYSKFDDNSFYCNLIYKRNFMNYNWHEIIVGNCCFQWKWTIEDIRILEYDNAGAYIVKVIEDSLFSKKVYNYVIVDNVRYRINLNIELIKPTGIIKWNNLSPYWYYKRKDKLWTEKYWIYSIHYWKVIFEVYYNDEEKLNIEHINEYENPTIILSYNKEEEYIYKVLWIDWIGEILPETNFISFSKKSNWLVFRKKPFLEEKYTLNLV